MLPGRLLIGSDGYMVDAAATRAEALNLIDRHGRSRCR